MDFNTIEDIETAFPDETSSRKFLCEIRWGKFASCPFCDNPKCYFLNKGTQFKCANPECYKKFTVITRTLLQSSNISLQKIIQAVFIFIKSSGRCMSWDFEKHIKVHFRSAAILKDKLDFAWKYVLKENRTINEKICDLFKSIFNLYEKYDNFKCEKYNSDWGAQFKGAVDFNNPQHYSKLILYTRCYLHFTHYIFIDFATPEDILAETFLWLRDNNIKDYDSDMLIKYINRTTSRMWKKFLNEHPKHNGLLRRSAIRSGRESRNNLKDTYVIEIIKNTKEGKGMTRSEIRSDKKRIKEKRELLKEGRRKRGRVCEHDSHFN